MQTVIFNPLEEYEKKYKELHLEKTRKFFDELTQRSGVNIEKNRETVRQYHACKEGLKKPKRKLNWLLFLRVLMCLTILLIPLVIFKLNPKIKALREAIENDTKKAEGLLEKAQFQMQPLNKLFTERDSLNLTEDSIPLLSFSPCFSAKEEADMVLNFDFWNRENTEQSTLQVISGRYNENPFLFENILIHTMGTQIYRGERTISWTETYRDSNGRIRTRTRTQTLVATVEKPKPFYSTQVVLNYGSQGAPDLCFSRDASHLDRKSDRAIERMVQRGERKLKKKTDKAIQQGDDFVSMSNTDFEVMFDALDRDNEVQFRTLFTPLAQTNMVDLIRSKVGYGDDFHFIKAKRMNRIIAGHSQGRPITVYPSEYASYDFDVIQQNFIQKNGEFFKAVYFDFAPLWAIPAYQERPVHSMKPIPSLSQSYSLKESEVLANTVDPYFVVHPNTKTKAILKSSFVRSKDNVDETCITAYSYDIAQRVDFVSVLGGDGRYHQVPVYWDEYLPLVASNHFFVTDASDSLQKNVIATRDNLCMFRSNP